MSILLFLILASLTLALCALVGFVWAVKTGQFDDTCTPSMRLLMDEAQPGITKSECRNQKQNSKSNSENLPDAKSAGISPAKTASNAPGFP